MAASGVGVTGAVGAGRGAGTSLGAKAGLFGLFAAILCLGALIERDLARGHGKRTDRSPRVGLLLEPLAEAPLPDLPRERAARGAAAARTYVVKEGDTLGKIAQKTLGSTAGWKAILALNREVLPGPERLRVGMELRIPGPSWRSFVEGGAGRADRGSTRTSGATPTPATGSGGVVPPAAAPPAASPEPGIYVVQPGDTLGAVAQKTLGSAREAGRLFEKNRDVLASPDALKVGMRLRVP